MDRILEKSVYDFLTLEKAYPKSEIQLEAAIGQRLNGAQPRADIAILDSRKSEVICLIEIKASRDHSALRSAIAQLLNYRRLLGKPHVPLYLFFPPLNEKEGEFQISQILPDGDTKEVFRDEFPSYDSLIKGDNAGKKQAKNAEVKSTVDILLAVCLALSMIVAFILWLDLSGNLQLTTKQLALLATSGSLLILPFAAKFKMLGVEFERYVPDQSNKN